MRKMRNLAIALSGAIAATGVAMVPAARANSNYPAQGCGNSASASVVEIAQMLEGTWQVRYGEGGVQPPGFLMFPIFPNFDVDITLKLRGQRLFANVMDGSGPLEFRWETWSIRDAIDDLNSISLGQNGTALSQQIQFLNWFTIMTDLQNSFMEPTREGCPISLVDQFGDRDAAKLVADITFNMPNAIVFTMTPVLMVSDTSNMRGVLWISGTFPVPFFGYRPMIWTRR